MAAEAVSFRSAVNAYNAATSRINGAGAGAAPQEAIPTAKAGFDDLIAQGVKSTTASLQQAEMLSSKSLVKQADITDVVTAVSNAELTLQAMVVIRDRLVTAYQEIVKMPI